ncbi:MULTISPECIES: hypothetical protein [unclassified Natrinema]|uniref:hypothetical protein n=1 Tax=unclassified Natrinema TaxID=2622230 RepID=UPI00026D51C4|nr:MULTISPECIES: hypothetical protein [unclassified Natrinema]AFO56710.1 hypothetical protein NJ7G_1465 [Natrinema sp. J7-2]
MIDRALEFGITFVETASVYPHGESETFRGRGTDRDTVRYEATLSRIAMNRKSVSVTRRERR